MHFYSVTNKLFSLWINSLSFPCHSFLLYNLSAILEEQGWTYLPRSQWTFLQSSNLYLFKFRKIKFVETTLNDIWNGKASIHTFQLLALLKYPFYPLFNFDNGMNLISESLTILTSAQLLVVFAFAHIFWRYFVFAGFWPILEHEMARPTITRWHEEWRRPKPEQRIEGHDD